MHICIILLHPFYLDAVRFDLLTDVVAENEGPITIKLRLDRPATEKISIPITVTSFSATGELYAVHMNILRY